MVGLPTPGGDDDVWDVELNAFLRVSHNEDGTLKNGGSLPSGAGSPAGVVTPSGIGALYIDDTNGALFVAAGVTDADWIQVGGKNGGGLLLTPGLIEFGFGSFEMVGNPQSAMTDVDASNNSGNGIYWNPNRGADGAQTAKVFTGVGKTTILADENGTMTLSDGGLMFPTADPHIVGAWWDNAGVLTKSMG